MAKKNQMAKGIEAKMPIQAVPFNTSPPAQPLAVKLLMEKPGATTPMNTSNSPMAKMVTNNSKFAAMRMPKMFKVMNTI